MPEAPPIDPHEPMETQSRHALMLARDQGLLSFKQPVDTTIPASVAAFRDEFGGTPLPVEPGVYYPIRVHSLSGERITVILPEGEVRSFVFALGVRQSRETAQQVLYIAEMLPPA